VRHITSAAERTRCGNIIDSLRGVDRREGESNALCGDGTGQRAGQFENLAGSNEIDEVVETSDEDNCSKSGEFGYLPSCGPPLEAN
jgi:hypothetical protein